MANTIMCQNMCAFNCWAHYYGYLSIIPECTCVLDQLVLAVFTDEVSQLNQEMSYLESLKTCAVVFQKVVKSFEI